MLTIINDTNIKIKSVKLKNIAKTLTKKDVECLFTNSEQMRKLNLENRGIDKNTDVLSFPLENLPHAPIGSIVIDLELADKTAKEFGHSLEDECSLLFMHGMLHLLGFDHESDNGEMKNKEIELINTFKLPKSLIERNS